MRPSKKPRLRRSPTLNELIGEKARDRRRRQEELRESEQSRRPPRNDLQPRIRIEERPWDAIRPPARHVRRAAKAQINRVIRSIQENGLVAPLVVSPDGEIIDGVIRWIAAGRLGLATIHVVVVEYLSPSQLKKLSITLNRTAELGEWDFEQLKVVFTELLEFDEDLTSTGFVQAEIDGLLFEEVDEADEGSQAEAMPTVEDVAVTRLGDLWQLGPHLLLCADCRDPDAYAELMRGESGQLLLTDQPYNVPVSGFVTSRKHREFAMASGEMSMREFQDFMGSWMAAPLPYLSPGALLASFIDWRSVGPMLAVGEELGFELLNIPVWVKSNAGMGSLWRSQHELCVVFKIDDAPHINNVELGAHGRWRSNAWFYPSGAGADDRKAAKGHVTPKNRQMIEDAILDITDLGDIVIDPFLGSGTAVIACETTGRLCRAIEIDPLYCDLAIRRWEAFTGEEAVLAETDETFAMAGRRKATGAAAQPLLMLPAPDSPKLTPPKRKGRR